MKITYLYNTDDFDSSKIIGGSASHIKGTTDCLCRYHEVLYCGNANVDINPGIQKLLVKNKPGFEFFKDSLKMKMLYSSFQEMYQRIKAYAPDLIYQRYSSYDWTGLKIARKLKKPFFLEFNSSEYWKSKNHWDKKNFIHLLGYSERIILENADRIFVVSKALQDKLVHENKIDEGKIIVNPNGVDIQKFSPNVINATKREEIIKKLSLTGKKVIGFVGTFGMWHGVEVLVESMKHLKQQGISDIVFLLVGAGDMLSYVQDNIKQYNLEKICCMVGKVEHSEIPYYLDICDVLLLPTVTNKDKSEFFGSPTKLFEYMAMAKPVIASAVGQLCEIIRHGENGMLFPERDSLKMNQYIVEILEDEELAQKLGLGARQTVSNEFTWEKNAQRIIDEYEIYMKR